jgi:hypothetical protein
MGKKEKTPVRLTLAGHVTNPQTGAREALVRATATVGNKSLNGTGKDEASALAALHARVQSHLAYAELRAQYPKTVEVEW